jgi:hypothetical protein
VMLDWAISLITVAAVGLVPWRQVFMAVSSYAWRFLVGPQKQVVVFVSWAVVQALLANAVVVVKGVVLMQGITSVGVNSLVGLAVGLVAHYWWDHRNNAHPAMVLLLLCGIYVALDWGVCLAFFGVTVAAAVGLQSLRLGIVLGCLSVFVFVGILGALPMVLMLNLVIVILILLLYWTAILRYVDHGSQS